MTNFTSTSSKPSPVPARDAETSRGARVLLGALAAYQRLTSGRIAPCRFYLRAPTTRTRPSRSTEPGGERVSHCGA